MDALRLSLLQILVDAHCDGDGYVANDTVRTHLTRLKLNPAVERSELLSAMKMLEREGLAESIWYKHRNLRPAPYWRLTDAGREFLGVADDYDSAAIQSGPRKRLSALAR